MTPNTNIITPITPDKLVGFDQFNQLWAYMQSPDDPDCYTGSIVWDVRDNKCFLCGNGWELNNKSFSNQHVSRCMDRPWLMHKTCYYNHEMYNEMHFMEKAIGQLGLEGSVLPIPNEYGKSVWNHPWWQFTVGDVEHKLGIVIKIGARKRVWQVSVHGLPLKHVATLVTIFANESVTKESREDSYLIHAWDEEKLHWYLQVIGDLIRGSKSEQHLEKAAWEARRDRIRLAFDDYEKQKNLKVQMTDLMETIEKFPASTEQTALSAQAAGILQYIEQLSYTPDQRRLVNLPLI